MSVRILIGIPCLDTLKTKTVTSLFSATAALQADAQLMVTESSLIHDARNEMAEAAVREGFTHVMFIDSDMQFPYSAIQELIDMDKDVAAGLYFRGVFPYAPTIAHFKQKKFVVPREWDKEKPFRVYSAGTGFMLIKTEVLKGIKAPWFGFGTLHGQRMGEDVYFCHRANERGFEVWCKPTFTDFDKNGGTRQVGLGHIKNYVVDEKDYQTYREGRAIMPYEEGFSEVH